MEEKQIYTINQIKMRISPILKEYGVRKATLFGSYSQGKATEKSDIDLLIDSGLQGLKFVGFENGGGKNRRCAGYIPYSGGDGDRKRD